MVHLARLSDRLYNILVSTTQAFRLTPSPQHQPQAFRSLVGTVNDSFDTETTQVADPLVMRAKARVGQVLKEKWHLDVLLGVGGMAAVYAVTHRNGSRAAVKLLHSELSTNRLVRARFLREGYVANAVGHEGAVKVIDDDEAEDGSLYLVTELLDGETLEDRRLRHGGQLDEAEVLWLADRILDVLATAHDKGIIHRDIKPDNVFVTRSGHVKVIDFGIARLREATSMRSSTKSGAAMGTPAFMPPEQARGLWDEVDARSDIWALGATMFNLLTGRLLHEARTANEHMLFSMTKNSPPLESLLPRADAGVCQLVNRSLAFDKNNRWRDARRMQDALRGAYYSRFGKPIAAATRLTVPATVVNRTLPGSTTPTPVPHLPTTARPVESSRNAPTVATPRQPRRVTAAMIGAALAFGLILTGAVWTVSSTTATGHSEPAVSTSPPARTSTSAVPSATTPTPRMTAPVDSAPTALAVPVPVPRAAPTPTAAPVPHAVRPHPSAISPTAATGTRVEAARPMACDPPFTINPVNGEKHFKIECL